MITTIDYATGTYFAHRFDCGRVAQAKERGGVYVKDHETFESIAEWCSALDVARGEYDEGTDEFIDEVLFQVSGKLRTCSCCRSLVKQMARQYVRGVE